jgi:tetratricopeptide (TPR) repeat protein
VARWAPQRRWWARLGAALLVFGLAAPQAWAWYHLRAARSALARHHPEEARAALSLCAQVWGSRASVRLLAGQAARRSGDLETAERELRECLRLQRGATDETAFEWALLQAAAGNVREVEEYLQKRASESPSAGPLAWEALAVGYLRVYRTLDAMACLNHWLKQEPDNVRALELRGTTFVTGRGVVKGAEDYRKVLAIDPGRRETRWRLVGCLLDLGGYDEAAGHLEMLARDAPGDPDVAARLARCYHMQGRGEEGRRLLDDALLAHPDHPMCLRTLGQLELNAGRKPQAEAALRRAATSLPDDYQAQWLLFQALQQQGKQVEAKEQLTRAEEVKERNEHFAELTSRKLAEHPLDPALHYEMGAILARTGRPDVAAQWYQSAISLDPGHRAAHAALANHFRRTGDLASAEFHASRAADR